MLSGNVLFKMEINESLELIIKSHFQWSVALRLQGRHTDPGRFELADIIGQKMERLF